MKKCKKCLEILPYDFFYQKKGSKDGYENVCTECKKSKARANRAKNREHYLAYDRERNSTLKRIEERKEHGSSYKGKLAQSRYKQANANTVKSKAQLAAKIAIQKGEIQKPLQCEKCKKFTLELQAHHEDYSRPLDVIFLCIPCHNMADANRRKRESG